jgi:hypothetical protein
MSAQATGAQRGFFRRFTGAGQSTEELRLEIEQLRSELAEANATAATEQDRLTKQIDQLNSEVNEERSKGFLRRLFGIRPSSRWEELETEATRERMRGRLAITLILALIALMALTFAYLLVLSRQFGDLTSDDLISLIPMVGSTLLTPLVGLIGAVMGFYFGGETAVSAASQTADATRSATQAFTSVQSATAAQYTAATAAQKATTPRQSAEAASRAAEVAAARALE